MVSKISLLVLLFFSSSYATEPISPIPEHVNLDEKKIQLGQKLFFDTRLSKDDSIACVSCHFLNDGGDDNAKLATGIYGKMGNLNTPTVFNAHFNFAQFWNGRSKNLNDQAKGPIENPLEMGSDFETLIPKLKRTEYNALFKTLYPEGLASNTLQDALAHFGASLITPNAPFDRYLKGEQTAITNEQKKGYALFKTKGCIACHHGVNIGGNHFNKFGLLRHAASDTLGRYEITKNEKDKYFFKVPSLRNIEHTAPYLHDGSMQNLEETVRFMASYQLGRLISDEEIGLLVQFLKSLNGELPAHVR